MLSFIIWDVSPEIFSLGSFSIRWYGLLFAVGFFIGQRVMLHIFKKEGLPEDWVDTLTLVMVSSTLVGARLGHYVFYEYPSLLLNPIAWLKDLVMPPYAGLASHGAGVGILLALVWFARSKKLFYWWVTDRVVITVALAAFFIRSGNLMNSEIIGKPTEVPWAFVFKQDSDYLHVLEQAKQIGYTQQEAESNYPALPRHPAQLYEALSSLVLFFLLMAIWRRYNAKVPHGLLTGIFFIWIFGLRFFYEFIKENQVFIENEMVLNIGQRLSIPAVMFGLLAVYIALKKKETRLFTNQ